MPSAKNNYDPVAGYYDRLSQIIFGKSIIRSQTCFLHFIKDDDSILIAGGGTGWLLETIAALHKKNIRVVFVDVSAKMIALARKRNTGELQVEFINSSVEELHLVTPFNIIITAFLFDNFNATTAQKNFNRLSQLLHKNGHWLFADFHIKAASPLRHKILLRMMYTFFRKAASVEAKKLPDMNTMFLQDAYHLAFEHWHYGRFIQSVAWQKT